MNHNFLSKKTLKAKQEIQELKQTISGLEAEAGRSVDLADPEKSAERIVGAEFEAKKLKLILAAKLENLKPMLIDDFKQGLKALSEEESEFDKQLAAIDTKKKEAEKKVESLKAESAGIQRQKESLQYTKKIISDEIRILQHGSPEPEKKVSDVSRIVDPRITPRPPIPARPKDLNIVTVAEMRLEKSLNN